jgi:hypothetical protein
MSTPFVGLSYCSLFVFNDEVARFVKFLMSLSTTMFCRPQVLCEQQTLWWRLGRLLLLDPAYLSTALTGRKPKTLLVRLTNNYRPARSRRAF